MKRVAALAGAVLMVLAAVFIRSKIDEDGGGTTSTTDSSLTIACVPEFEAACASLSGVKVVVEDPAATAVHLNEVDGWVTLDPWPAVLDVRGEVTPIASTPLVIAMVKERAAALAPACGGTINWKCLFDVAGRQWSDVGGDAAWGPVKVGLPPRTSATGLLLTGEAVAGYFGRTDFFTNDFDGNFTLWFSHLRDAAVVADPLARFIQQFPAAYSAVGTTQAGTSTGLGVRRDQTQVITPNPAVRAVAILVQRQGGDSVKRLSDKLRESLVGAGWEQSVDNANLPDAGVLLNLRDR